MSTNLKKAAPEDMPGRIAEIQSDPCNARIPRVPNAGEIVDGHLVMHNGLTVKPVDKGYLDLLQSNQSCHEPQEEWIFQQLLPHIPENGTILELGAYWAFYSMWFAKEVPNACCLMVEPKKRNLKLGQYNFKRNGFEGSFFRRRIGHGAWGLDRFFARQQVAYVDVLHVDIQGYELEMLRDAHDSLSQGRVGYVFVGTHSQDLHYQCRSVLMQQGYEIIAHADFDFGTYCCDGVLVARHHSQAGLGSVDLPLRDAEGQARAEQEMESLAVSIEPPKSRRPWFRQPVV